MDVSTLFDDDVRDLAAHAAHRGSVIAFQSTLAAAAQAVQHALAQEEAVGEAALSLAHRDALRYMTTELRVTRSALESALDGQGRRLMPTREARKKRPFRLRPRAPRRREAPQRLSWFGSLADAIEVLDEEAERMGALVSGQPPEAPSRALGTATAHLLRDHHAKLVAEAARAT
ncbi:MAG: hypothetical protein AAGF99_17405 [Bacteroidota bacterium]